MSEESNVSSESTSDTKNTTNEVSDAKDVPTTAPILGNQTAARARNDIYDRFDKTVIAPQETQSDSSSATEESSTEEDLKENSGPEQHTEKVSEDSEKPTSVKKGKELKDGPKDHKTVPLQALHESRERFKKLNLEYRDYKSGQEKEITELKSQLQKLQTVLQTDKTTPSNDFVDDDEEKSKLRQEVASLKKKYEFDESAKAREATVKAQQDFQAKIQRVTTELAEQGYPGFDIAILKVDAKLKELADSGEITSTELQDPEMWKKVYIENDIYSSMKQVFTEQEKQDLMDRKKDAKKKANLIADPGKAPEKPQKEEEETLSYDEFNKRALKERMDDQKKRFYKRRT